jgi:Fic family protein
MKRGETGTYEAVTAGGETVRTFLPTPLPPLPPLSFDGQLQRLMETAVLALGRLDGVSTLLPDKSLFLYGYVRKEAVLSSQIEGTQSSLSDLLLFELNEIPGVPLDDVVEVSNYVAALDHGLARLKEGFPLSNRLIREVHGVLLSRGRGSGKEPGEFRRIQNWIGGTRSGNAMFVPPPHLVVPDAWRRWSASSMVTTTACRFWRGPGSRTSSLRPFIPFWMAMAVSVGSSLPCFYVMQAS